MYQRHTFDNGDILHAEQINAIDAAVEIAYRQAAANDHRLDALEAAAKGELYTVQSDDTEAYSKTVPSGAMPAAEIEKVYGRCVELHQAMDHDNTIAVTDTSAFRIERNAAKRRAIFTATSSIGTLSIAHAPMYQRKATLGGKYYCDEGDRLYYACTVTITGDEGHSFKFCGRGNNKSETGAPLTSHSAEIPVAANSTAFIDSLVTVQRYAASQYADNASRLVPCIRGLGNGETWAEGDTVQFDGFICVNLTRMFGATAASAMTIEDCRGMFTADTPYAAGTLMPFGVKTITGADAYELPEAVLERCEDYGASAGTAYNWIDFVNKKYHHCVAYRDLGELTLVKSERVYRGTAPETYEKTYRFATTDTPAKPATTSVAANIVCDGFDPVAYLAIHYVDNTSPDSVTTGISVTSTGNINFCRSDLGASTTAAEAKAAVAGMKVAYEIAEEVIDLSDVLTDAYITVAAAGAVKFDCGGTSVPVKSKINYMIKTT